MSERPVPAVAGTRTSQPGMRTCHDRKALEMIVDARASLVIVSSASAQRVSCSSMNSAETS